MTTRIVGSLGTATRSGYTTGLAHRTRLTGTLDVGGEEATVVTVVSDDRHSTTAEQSGAGEITINVDHMTHRGPTPVTVADQIVVLRAGVPFAASVVGDDVTVDAWAAPGAPSIGVQIAVIQPGVLPPLAHLPYETVLDAMPPGLGHVRLGIPWSVLQPDSSAWDETEASYFDAVFAELDSRGLAVILTLGGTPAWAGGGASRLDPPTNASDHQAWYDAVFDRWGSAATILSVDPWNESNLPSFWPGTTAKYLDTMRACKAGVAGRAPVALGSISLGDYAYVAELLGLGMTGADFDVLDLHPYPIEQDLARWRNPRFPPPAGEYPAGFASGIHMIEQTLAEAGITSRDIYITEVGVATNPNDAVPGLRVTDARAADWIARCMEAAAHHQRIQAITVHEAIDLEANPAQSWAGGFGLLDAGFTRRAKWSAVASIIA